MPNNVDVTVTGSIPFEYLQDFLQRIRNFESQDPEHAASCAIGIWCDAPHIGTDEIAAVFETLTPAFSSGVHVFKGGGVAGSFERKQ